ncbi:MAG: two pore domain potassium channel family protein [Reyranella sp.]|uniref:potassium channel family protein n=1 Tax=Reyranella sp. TaxID=1929291 RepID=UPI00120B3BC7|nr:potassium channel family protein [Reyranella sp.]TAJ40066.1 MAG: two pore domain potassium channel family protein [Reyranella sp.]
MIRSRLLRRVAYARRNRCSVLVAVLCLFILLNPLLSGSMVGATALAASLFVILILAVWALRVRQPFVWGLAALAFLTIDALVADRLGETWIRPLALAATAAFISTVTVALLRYVLDRRAITTDKVFGAVAAYILIALSFASLFGLLQVFEPQAFNAAVAHGPDGRLNWSDLMYFSFTVLTSTGFGEITPATPLARALIIIEQVLGVMYVAFLIARLANMYGHERHRG